MYAKKEIQTPTINTILIPYNCSQSQLKREAHQLSAYRSTVQSLFVFSSFINTDFPRKKNKNKVKHYKSKYMLLALPPIEPTALKGS